jgi:hypothetical protein
MDKNELPKGWGNNDEDDDYEYDAFDDDESVSPWENKNEDLQSDDFNSENSSESDNSDLPDSHETQDNSSSLGNTISGIKNFFTASENDNSDETDSQASGSIKSDADNPDENDNQTVENDNSDETDSQASSLIESDANNPDENDNQDVENEKSEQISTYDSYPQKESSSFKIFLGIIICLICACVVINSIYFWQNMNHDSDTHYVQPINVEKSNKDDEDTDEDKDDDEKEENNAFEEDDTVDESLENILTENFETTAEADESDVMYQDNDGYSNSSLYNAYLNILNSLDSTPMRGFLVDLNNDGYDEMILPESNSFRIYSYSNGNIWSRNFGGYMAVGNFRIFEVTNNDGKKYLYYRDEYSYKSMQGYYYLDTAESIDVYIDYPYENGVYFADWNISYTSSSKKTYANGYEGVDTFYGQPAECHNKLINALSDYGFNINDSSSYNEMYSLKYDALISVLENSASINFVETGFAGESEYGYPTGYVATESSGLNMRSSPSKSADIIMELPKGTYFHAQGYPIAVDGLNWQYIQVIYNGNEYYGYVSSDYVHVMLDPDD